MNTANLIEKLEQLQTEVVKFMQLLLSQDMAHYADELRSALEQLWALVESLLNKANLAELFAKAEEWVVAFEVKLYDFFEKPDLEWAHQIIDAILSLIHELKDRTGLAQVFKLFIPQN